MEAKKENHKELDDLQAKVLFAALVIVCTEYLNIVGGCTAGIYDG